MKPLAEGPMLMFARTPQSAKSAPALSRFNCKSRKPKLSLSHDTDLKFTFFEYIFQVKFIIPLRVKLSLK